MLLVLVYNRGLLVAWRGLWLQVSYDTRIHTPSVVLAILSAKTDEFEWCLS